ncbi:MAG: DUF1802 family protein [Armatimonadota bacterium]
MTTITESTQSADCAPNEGLPPRLSAALKEWAVAIRALREGRQILLLRKGGIREEGGEFEVQTRDVLLFPTYEHQMEQAGMLQPCYGAWLQDEQRRKPTEGNVRLDIWARITDILIVRNFDALYTLKSQHIYDDSLLKFRTENEPHKPLYALFLRAYELPASITLPMEMDYYGCKSWISLTEPVETGDAKPVLSDHTYSERVRVTRRLLEGDTAHAV